MSQEQQIKSIKVDLLLLLALVVAFMIYTKSIESDLQTLKKEVEQLRKDTGIIHAP